MSRSTKLAIAVHDNRRGSDGNGHLQCVCCYILEAKLAKSVDLDQNVPLGLSVTYLGQGSIFH